MIWNLTIQVQLKGPMYIYLTSVVAKAKAKCDRQMDNG